MRRAALLFLTLGATPAGAQGTLPPIRQLGPIVASVSDTLISLFGVRQLSDGRLIVNDRGGRKLLLIDSTLHHSTPILDSTSDPARRYPASGGKIYGYLADSTLFMDPVASTLLVIDPRGAVVRTLALPTTGIQGQNTPFSSRLDAHNRIVFRSLLPGIQPPTTSSAQFISPIPAESALVLRVDIQTRLVDTVAYFRVAKEYPVMGRDSSGFTWVDVEANPLPIVDAWAVLSDGTIAIVRGSDYHVDYFDADGSRRSSGKLPHEWRRLSDSAKTALIDSLTKVYAANPTAFATNVNGQHVQSPGVQTATVNGVTRSHIIIPRFPDISELPDYPAPFADVKADGDGNLWILETASGTVWDVVNHAGVMIDRVQIPGGTSIEWFGPGVVYLTSRLGTTVSLVRARIR